LNPLAVLLTIANAVFALMITLTLKSIGMAGIWYAISGAGGALAGKLRCHCIGATDERSDVVGVRTPRRRTREKQTSTGSLWMFVLTIGLRWPSIARLILSHVSTPGELSRYALMAQIFAVVWMVFDTAGMALWPVSSNADRTSLPPPVVAEVGGGVRGVVPLSPVPHRGFGTVGHIGAVGGHLGATRALAVAFAVMLFVECIHLPGGIMLTMRERPDGNRSVSRSWVDDRVLGIWWREVGIPAW